MRDFSWKGVQIFQKKVGQPVKTVQIRKADFRQAFGQRLVCFHVINVIAVRESFIIWRTGRRTYHNVVNYNYVGIGFWERCHRFRGILVHICSQVR